MLESASSPALGLARMATVNEYLMRKGLDQYIWAFATQGFEGPECLRELMALDEVGLDRLATQTLRNAERALGVVSTEPDEDETQYVTSVLPGLYVEIPSNRLGRAKGKTFTEYCVDVHTVDSNLASQTWHRYSEFEELRTSRDLRNELDLKRDAEGADLHVLLRGLQRGVAIYTEDGELSSRDTVWRYRVARERMCVSVARVSSVECLPRECRVECLSRVSVATVDEC